MSEESPKKDINIDQATYDAFIARAQLLESKGFSSKDDVTKYVRVLNGAYAVLKSAADSAIFLMYEMGPDGNRSKNKFNQDLSRIQSSIPRDLQRYNEEDLKPLLEVSESFQEIVYQSAALFLCYQSVAPEKKVEPLKKTKAEFELERARNLNSPAAIALRSLRKDAVDQAIGFAQERILEIYSILDEADWDLSLVSDADRPACAAITEAESKNESNSDLDEQYRSRSLALEKCFIDDVELAAGNRYDLFVLKACERVGRHRKAVLEGDHVRGDSYLTVRKEGGQVEVWRTRKILSRTNRRLKFNRMLFSKAEG